MSDLFIVSRDSIPRRLHSADMGYALRSLTLSELVSIEDCFFKQGDERKIRKGSSTLIFPDVNIHAANLDEYSILAEFSLSLLASSGHPSFFIGAIFTQGSCTYAKHLSRYSNEVQELKFSALLKGTAVVQWLRRCLLAQKNLKDRMHITASRYVRYARSENISDGLMDLCICLESLLDSQTEISFRFGVCLTKLTGEKGQKAEEMATLLSELYDLRSKIAHGDPAAIKMLKQIEPKRAALHMLARRILTTYVFFMSEHLRHEWQSHVRSSIYA